MEQRRKRERPIMFTNRSIKPTRTRWGLDQRPRSQPKLLKVVGFLSISEHNHCSDEHNGPLLMATNPSLNICFQKLTTMTSLAEQAHYQGQTWILKDHPTRQLSAAAGSFSQLWPSSLLRA